MKKLLFNGEITEAENISKTSADITGTDQNNNEIFSFKGISDFSKFQLQDENNVNIEFSIPPKTEIELLQQENINLKQSIAELAELIIGGV